MLYPAMVIMICDVLGEFTQCFLMYLLSLKI